MKNKSKMILIGILLTLFTLSGMAEDTSKFGFHFKASELGNVGVTYKLSEKLEIRAGLGFSFTSANHQGGDNYLGEINQDINSTEVSIGLFQNVLTKSKLTLYAGLEGGLVSQKEEAVYSDYSWENTKYTYHGFHVSGVFGIRHKLTRHLSVFGEFCLGYNSLDAGSDLNYTSHSWNLKRSGFGIILYI
ncbi:MAG: outer membrane beta-barrel protein [bacterium]|nr:outer membrane beta-barrel protein [bacterium]